MNLKDLPLDILLEITEDLDLPDSLHLISTCTEFKPILHLPHFWIMSLKRIQQIHRRPLPCSPGTDIPALPLDRLRELAIHAYKLRKTWASKTPAPVSFHYFKIRDEPIAVLPIQGTRMVVTISVDRLTCWDTTSGESLAALNCAGNQPWIPSAFPFIRPGMCAIGMAYPSVDGMSLRLAIVAIDHRNPSVLHVSEVLARTWTTPRNSSVCCVVATETGIASVIINDEDTFLLFSRIGDEILHRVPLGLVGDSTSPRCAIVEDGFLITRQCAYSKGSVDIIHVRAAASATDTDTFPVHKVTREFFFYGEQTFGLEPCNTRVPLYGILNVTTCYSMPIYPSDDFQNYNLQFWPAEYDDHNSTLTVGELYFMEHESHITELGVGSSATCAVTRDYDGVLGLVQYVSHGHPTPHVEFRELDIDGRDVTHLALDDGLGVVYLVTREAGDEYDLTVASYA
ncbi:hypothetical protein B0H11DRAFT_2105977 [Mycena galericulata]|nr:hypothetical protein B0H11DRAFT_2105977 [Mycena galericulata]